MYMIVTCMQSIRVSSYMSELLRPQLASPNCITRIDRYCIGEPQLEDVAEWVSRCGISIPLAESGLRLPYNPHLLVEPNLFVYTYMYMATCIQCNPSSLLHVRVSSSTAGTLKCITSIDGSWRRWACPALAWEGMKQLLIAHALGAAFVHPRLKMLRNAYPRWDHKS